MTWTVKNTLTKIEQDNFSEAGVSSLLASVLANRGISPDTANAVFNNPLSLLLDPLGITNIKEAAHQIIQAVENGDEIWINADYDADGMTSGFVFSDFLRSTTDNAVYPYYPNRSEGYGLSMDFCQSMIARQEETGKKILVITVDNGITCVEQVRYLKENNVGVLVTDHHQPKGELPDCIIVNPQIMQEDTYKHLCGCSVAFKVIQAIQTVAGLPKDYASKYYYAVAIGTIADMMPNTVENMALIKLGLGQLNSKECPYVFQLWKKFLGIKKVTPMDVGWEIGPRLNACGRMGNSDLGGIILSFKDDAPKEEVNDVILEIEDLNQERKALTDKAKKEMLTYDYSGHAVCMFDASKYPGGISGIIAGKLLELTGKPSVAYAGEEVCVASMRSPHGLDVQPILGLEMMAGNVIQYGGHHEAAGFSFYKNDLESLQAGLDETVLALRTERTTESEEQTLQVDAVVTLKDVNMNNYYDLQSFYYDKALFTAPVVALENVQVKSVKYSKNNENNICLTVLDDSGKTSMIWAWGCSGLYKELGEPTSINLIGNIDVNFMDKRSATLRVLAIEAA